jgi:hypothetical protein
MSARVQMLSIALFELIGVRLRLLLRLPQNGLGATRQTRLQMFASSPFVIVCRRPWSCSVYLVERREGSALDEEV